LFEINIHTGKGRRIALLASSLTVADTRIQKSSTMTSQPVPELEVCARGAKLSWRRPTANTQKKIKKR